MCCISTMRRVFIVCELWILSALRRSYYVVESDIVLWVCKYSVYIDIIYDAVWQITYILQCNYNNVAIYFYAVYNAVCCPCFNKRYCLDFTAHSFISGRNSFESVTVEPVREEFYYPLWRYFMPRFVLMLQLAQPWASAHRGKWGQLTPWKNGWKNKKRKHAKRAVFCVCVIFWEQSGQAGVENGAMLTTY